MMMANLREATLTDNMEAKMNQQLGCTLGIVAGSNASFGIVHAIGSVNFNLKGPHGYKCGVLLPHAMEFNMPVCKQKFAQLATILGEVPYQKTTSELANCFVRQVKQLLIELDFPSKFGPENLSKDKIPELLKEVKRNSPPFQDFNLRNVTDHDIVRLCEHALKGWELDSIHH